MEIAQAHALVSSPKAVFEDRNLMKSVPATPDVMSVLPLRHDAQSRAACNDEGPVFVFQRHLTPNSHLFPCPEKIAGKYPRYDFKVDLFIGDEHGCFVTNPLINAQMKSHGDVVKWLASNGGINSSFQCPGQWITKPVLPIGSPKQVHHLYAGTILPRQAGVDATYMSFWTSNAFDHLHERIFDHVKRTRYIGPYFYERNESGDLSSNHYEVVPTGS
jgi:hypothetical protein